jgi:hypothetical protein
MPQPKEDLTPDDVDLIDELQAKLRELADASSPRETDADRIARQGAMAAMRARIEKIRPETEEERAEREASNHVLWRETIMRILRDWGVGGENNVDQGQRWWILELRTDDRNRWARGFDTEGDALDYAKDLHSDEDGWRAVALVDADSRPDDAIITLGYEVRVVTDRRNRRPITYFA